MELECRKKKIFADLEVLPKPMDTSVLIIEGQAHWGRSKKSGVRLAHSRVNKPTKVSWSTHVLVSEVENVAFPSTGL